VKTRFVVALLLFAIVGLNQPASAASTGAVKPPIPQKTPGDAQIERTIKAKLAKSKLNADHFTVSVTGGVATLEGTTNVMQHKGTMTRMAKTSGAIAVHNNIRVSDAAKAKSVAALESHRAAADPKAAAPGASDATSPTSPTSPSSAAAAPIPRAMVLPAGTAR